jgi:hypothetical protein
MTVNGDTETSLTIWAIDLAHHLVDDLRLSEDDKIRALDDAVADLRHRWLLAGKPQADVLIDAQAFRTVVHRTMAALQVQRRRK